ncbi:2'-5' RNA ligase family protein [Nocardioides litoris]|uniref:2'-5' RNA ligase family protein n=1 Tax=Nocardioides litoris TaxID=1926648 RepID=UPI001FE92FA3|nr:2'-5' RNA ligase family protein [Nocardioides litoris]
MLAVPVRELDGWVRERTERQDASFVSADPGFIHAHVTVLGPWLSAPTPADLAEVAEVVAAEPAFEVELAEVGEFPDGNLHLRPEPDGPFRRLTAALAVAFPATPPYAGRYAEVVPHLTLDHRLTGATVDSLRAELAEVLPVRSRVERVDLQWWANHDCHRRCTWPLGGAA